MRSQPPPTRAEPICQARRIGVTRHAGGQSALTIEDAKRAGEASAAR